MEGVQLCVRGLHPTPIMCLSRAIFFRLDLFFWYDSAFGSPVARVQCIGYVQELVARLTHTPIAVHNSSTNATLDDNPVTFPLGQSLYVDATHEVVVLNSMYYCCSFYVLELSFQPSSSHCVKFDQFRR